MKRKGADFIWFTFNYERLPTFCFICGKLGHSDKFCDRLFDTPLDQIVKPYGARMRALPRGMQSYGESKWLRPGARAVQSEVGV